MSLKESFDRANANTLSAAFQKVKLGQTLRQDVRVSRRKVNPVALGVSAYCLATLHVVVLPDDAKASSVLRAYARAGTAGTGEMATVARHATPASGQIAVTPSGDIAVLAADAITDLDFEYLAARYDVIELVLPVAANVLTIPATYTARGVMDASQIEALAGTAVGEKIILTPGAGAPAAGQARLDVAKATVTFAAADAVTSARVRLQLTALADLDALLESTPAEVL